MNMSGVSEVRSVVWVIRPVICTTSSVEPAEFDERTRPSLQVGLTIVRAEHFSCGGLCGPILTAKSDAEHRAFDSLFLRARKDLHLERSPAV